MGKVLDIFLDFGAKYFVPCRVLTSIHVRTRSYKTKCAFRYTVLKFSSFVLFAVWLYISFLFDYVTYRFANLNVVYAHINIALDIHITSTAYFRFLRALVC